ncbi:MAG: GNAT family N-acetyltransferase [Marinovum sp.]|nr:GNAT family N-acetyltransferase [Marinovum sp.]
MTLTAGFHPLPKGHLSTVVTHLEMTSRPSNHTRQDIPDGLSLTAHPAPSVDWYRDLYRRVGQNWLWFSRLVCRDAELAATIHDADVHIFSIDLDGHAEGICELDFREGGKCELAFFGLTEKLIGTGAGRALMSHAISEAFARDIELFYVHTCTLDSPQALSFYIRSGFTPVRQEIEIAPDPRVTGVIDRRAAPQIPIFD